MIESCPLFITIGTDKIFEKKIKELIEEKSELLKLNQCYNEKIFKIEQELMTLKNEIVFDEKQANDQLNKLNMTINKLKEENEKLIK